MLSDRCLSCLSCPVLSVTLVYCGQTVGWINLGVQVGFGPGYIVLDGDRDDPLTKRGTSAPTVEIYERRLCLRPYDPRPMSIVAKRLDGSR